MTSIHIEVSHEFLEEILTQLKDINFNPELKLSLVDICRVSICI